MMLPTHWMQAEIAKEATVVKACRYPGIYYDVIGTRIRRKYGFSDYAIGSRMYQLGFIEARGALNWQDGVDKANEYLTKRGYEPLQI